jgi:hypothetical protein
MDPSEYLKRNLTLHKEQYRGYIVVKIGRFGLPVIRIYYLFFRQNTINFGGLCGLTVGKWRRYLSRQLEKWLPKMAREVLAVWIKPFAVVELAQSCVYTSIP